MRSEKKGVEFGKNRQVGVIRNWEPVYETLGSRL